MSGEIYVHSECKPAAHLQISQFNPLKRDNTDGILDLLTYAPKVIEMYGQYVMSMNVIEAEDWSNTEMTDELLHSPF
jgi:hypothetical protein